MRSTNFALVLCCSAAVLFAGVSSLPGQDSSYAIRLRSRTFTPEPKKEGGVQAVIEQGDKSPQHVILQFRRELTSADREQFAAIGIVFHGWLGGNAYSATLPRSMPLGGDADLGLLRATEKFRPGDRLSPSLAKDSKKPLPDWAKDGDTGRIKILVQFFPDVRPERIAKLFKSLSLEARRQGPGGGWATVADREQIEKMASWDEVRTIEPGPMPIKPLDAESRELTNADAAQHLRFSRPNPIYEGLSGLGVSIGICDTGVDRQHADFSSLDGKGSPCGSRIRVDEPPDQAHGTHVASIAAGNGFGSASTGQPAFSLRGYAPEAEIGAYPNLNDSADLHSKATLTDKMDVTNHSYVQSLGVYEQVGHNLDLFLKGRAKDSQGRSIPARPQVWAAGNNGETAQYGDAKGYYAVFTTAKNPIAVGAVDSVDGHLSAFSSLGPTLDGRIKPDLVAPGAYSSQKGKKRGILAAKAGDQKYTEMSGTSMAAPVVSATVGLMSQQLRKTRPGRAEVRPSTYKALLIHSARDCVHTHPCGDASREVENPDTKAPVLYHAGPDYATGFGLLDVRAACEITGSSQLWREATFTQDDEVQLYTLTVPPGEKELKIVIAWDDEPADPLLSETAPKLVNDLDLLAKDPGKNDYLPWILDPLPLSQHPETGELDPIRPSDVKPAHRGVDHLNNVEMVTVPLPEAGDWVVQVRAARLRQGPSQSYSLVSSVPIRP